MKFNTDLDTSIYPVSHVELVDLNLIHMIRILLYVTPLYTIGINEFYTIIILSNSYLFPMRFVLLSGYYSFLYTAQ